MQKKIYNNVVGHRVLDDRNVVEDVTSVTLPDVKHPTTNFNTAGMVIAVDIPDTTRYEPMSFAIAHNNGINGNLLARPGRHSIEVRVARQDLDIPTSEVELESVKYRITCLHVGTTKGNVEMGNPLGYTDNFSVLGFQEEVNGVITRNHGYVGPNQVNGVDYGSKLETLLG